jgi:hypothetical protein
MKRTKKLGNPPPSITPTVVIPIQSHIQSNRFRTLHDFIKITPPSSPNEDTSGIKKSARNLQAIQDKTKYLKERTQQSSQPLEDYALYLEGLRTSVEPLADPSSLPDSVLGLAAQVIHEFCHQVATLDRSGKITLFFILFIFESFSDYQKESFTTDWKKRW